MRASKRRIGIDGQVQKFEPGPMGYFSCYKSVYIARNSSCVVSVLWFTIDNVKMSKIFLCHHNF